jgi:hypothetical protein
MRYAAQTSVPVSRSVAEINDMVVSWGAEDFGYFQDGGKAVVSFMARNRRVRFSVVLVTDRAVRDSLVGKWGFRHKDPTDSDVAKIREQETRRKWRALALSIKAKLVAVDDTVETFEEAFLAHIVDPHSNQTVAEIVTARLEQAYTSGRKVPLLPPME